MAKETNVYEKRPTDFEPYVILDLRQNVGSSNAAIVEKTYVCDLRPGQMTKYGKRYLNI